jgi:hypothetical protein
MILLELELASFKELFANSKLVGSIFRNKA